MVKCLVHLCDLTEGKIWKALAEVGLKGFEDVPVANLSAGQKRRVGLARLYLEDTKVWILDEPLTAIDVVGVENLRQRFMRHVESGGAIVLTTHQSLEWDGAQKEINLSKASDFLKEGAQ